MRNELQVARTLGYFPVWISVGPMGYSGWCERCGRRNFACPERQIAYLYFFNFLSSLRADSAEGRHPSTGPEKRSAPRAAPWRGDVIASLLSSGRRSYASLLLLEWW